MRATSQEIDGNKVRLSVAVDEAEIDGVLGEAIRTISKRARVPGFRPGKVPRQVLEARMGGAGALRSEALREAIPDFYARALVEAEIDPISAPEIDVTQGEESGALSFDALVEVRPAVAIPGYAGLRVTVPSPTVQESEIDAQIDRLRETDAELVAVERPAQRGDHVTIDLRAVAEGNELTSVDDLLYEIGSDQVRGLDERLTGAAVGDTLEFTLEVPSGAQPSGDQGDHATDEPARQIEYKVAVKELQEKKLPEVTDEWAGESSEHETVAELREGLRDRLGKVKAFQAQLALRGGATAALAGLVEEEAVPQVLVDDQLRDSLNEFGRRLEEQRLTVANYLAMSGQSEERLLETFRNEALEQVKVDLALRALAREEGMEASEADLEAQLGAMASELGITAEVVRERLTHAGRMSALRSEQKKAKALSWLLEHVEVVDEEGNPVSRERLKSALVSAEGTAETDRGEDMQGAASVDDPGVAADPRATADEASDQ